MIWHTYASAGPESKTSESVGTVRSVSTARTNMTHRNVEASEDEPRYEVPLFHSALL